MMDIYTFFQSQKEMRTYTFEARCLDDLLVIKMSTLGSTPTRQHDSVMTSCDEQDDIAVIIEQEEEEEETNLPAHHEPYYDAHNYSANNKNFSCEKKKNLTETTFHHSRHMYAYSNSIGEKTNIDNPLEMLNFFRQCSIYMIVMSDGLSDVLSTQHISDIIFQKPQEAWDVHYLAEILTKEAASV